MRSDPATPIARLSQAQKRYGAITALAGIDLEIRRGELLALLGPNGAGKSTALGLLTGRFGADGGQVSVFGADPRDAATLRRFGVVQQEAKLPETMQVRELVNRSNHVCKMLVIIPYPAGVKP